MKVLFWVDAFPTYSETFIRDQIMSLLDQGIDVVIYPNNGKIKESELDALQGFEAYNLLDRVVDIDCFYKKNKISRLIRLIIILGSNIFGKNFKYYIESLSFNKYGPQAKALRLFFRSHFILKNNFDAIHAHFGPNGNRATVYKEMGLPIKLFTTFHGYDIRLGIAKGRHIYNTLFEQADGIFAISDYNYKNLINFGILERNLIYLTNGINLSFFKRKNKINDTGVIKVLTVARLVKEKALDIAINSIYKLLKKRPELEIEYTIIGGGELEDELKNLIESLHLSRYVKLIGPKHSFLVCEHMVNSDLFLLSSEDEAIPTVILEAQAAEMVVLATDVGSVRDIVRGGIIVSPSDSEVFSDGIIKLLTVRSDWASIAKKGRDYINEFHNIEIQTNNLIELYEKK